LRVREWYRTEGFNELAFDMVTEVPYQKSAAKLNRFRWQTQGGTPYRTLANAVEIEGKRIEEKINEKTVQILEENGFYKNGVPENSNVIYGVDRNEVKMPRTDVITAIEEYNTNHTDEKFHIDISEANQFYEDPASTVNISIDDVGVKEQKETGRSTKRPRKLKRKYVHNTIAHIESSGMEYVLNARNTVAMIPILIAFLVNNVLLGKYVQFYVDGARTLQSAIFAGFAWLKSFGLILDWYHLKKKCEMELSLALKGSQIRNEVLELILPQLWLGKIDTAIKMLRDISESNLKKGKDTETLIGYFERNRAFIPCYALRKKLNLRNSSNRGEKENDLIVADRQKHNGMSWSKDGSVSLATVTALHKNKGQKNWFKNGTLEFKLVA